ncbi:MAG: hypothetical protein Q9208_000449 [Pyrenodesmia sp. 3 TL-2023]
MGPSRESKLNTNNEVGAAQKPEPNPTSINKSTATAGGDVAIAEDQPRSRDDTAVAKESIIAATDKASELVTTARNSAARSGKQTRNASPSVYLSRTLRGSNRSLPVAASTTKIDVSADSPKIATEGPERLSRTTTAAIENEASSTKRRGSNEKQTTNLTSKLNPSHDTTLTQPEDEPNKASNETRPWRGWFLRNGDTAKPEPPEPPTATAQSANSEVEIPTRRRNSDPSTTRSRTDEEALPRSWLGLWATTRSVKALSADGSAYAAASSHCKPSSSSGPDTPSTEQAAVVQRSPVTSTSKSPGWAFWSRGLSRDTIDDATPSNQGELVVAEPRSGMTPGSPTSDAAPTVSAKRSSSVDTVRKAHNSQSSRVQTESDTSCNLTKKQKITAQSEPLQAHNTTPSQNLLLPSIAGTYRLAPRLSLLESLSRWWQDDHSDKTNGIQLLHSPPRIKRALAIGIHGYFPAPLIRSVLGQPTGTSVRFADGAANAIQTWALAHKYECEIEKVALEGEGRILERVDLLWKLLLNWIDNIRRADFVMVACHSQGVPVAIMLIAKLIEFGCVHGARIGVCAMAGVNLGPFIDFKSRWIGGSAGELFEFARPDSKVSEDYEAALTTTLKFGTRIAYIGSIDDQLVSLENALETTAIREGEFRRVRGEAPSAQNPYILPFSLRGVLEEDYVKNELHEETSQLLRQFDDWKPSTKVLKDVKFRLEGVRSKL